MSIKVIVKRPSISNVMRAPDSAVIVKRPNIVKFVVQSANIIKTLDPLEFSFTATQGQTAFVLAYNIDKIIYVAKNRGILSQDLGDFTVSGKTITLTTGADDGDTIYGKYTA